MVDNFLFDFMCGSDTNAVLGIDCAMTVPNSFAYYLFHTVIPIMVFLLIVFFVYGYFRTKKERGLK